MATTTYLSTVVLEELGIAQAVIDHHLVACRVCAVQGRCSARREADEIFNRYGQLARRTPGLTRRPAVL